MILKNAGGKRVDVAAIWYYYIFPITKARTFADATVIPAKRAWNSRTPQ
jgi:hypothetical protein